MKKLIVLTLIFLSVLVKAEDFSYRETPHRKMDGVLFENLNRSLAFHGYLSFLKNPTSQDKLGPLNQIYFDSFLYSYVHIKYGIEGNFKTDHFYNTQKGKLIHLKTNSGAYIALHFSGTSKEQAYKVIETFKKISNSSKNSFRNPLEKSINFVFPSAHADTSICVDTTGTSVANFEQVEGITSRGIAGRLMDCLGTAISSGASDIGNMWNGITDIFKNPRKAWDDAVSFTTQAADSITNIARAVISSPSEFLQKVSGETQQLFGDFFGAIEKMSTDDKWNAVCDLIGDAGVGIIGIGTGIGAVKLTRALIKVTQRVRKIIALSQSSRMGSILYRAVKASELAADRISSWTPKNKHLQSGRGSNARFNTDDFNETRSLVKEALESPNAQILPNPSIEGTFTVVTDLGREVGRNGRSRIRVIVGLDGRVINAFPVNTR